MPRGVSRTDLPVALSSEFVQRVSHRSHRSHRSKGLSRTKSILANGSDCGIAGLDASRVQIWSCWIGCVSRPVAGFASCSHYLPFCLERIQAGLLSPAPQAPICPRLLPGLSRPGTLHLFSKVVFFTLVTRSFTESLIKYIPFATKEPDSFKPVQVE